jgi:single-stranded-DNA-specific exonuclease
MISDDNARPFLGVSKSVSGRFWREHLDNRARNQALAITQTANLPELVARVLAARGVEAASAERFMDPTIRDLMPDPLTLTGMAQAVERLCRAIESRERVAIFGDYDVDGAAASALMHRFLRHHGISAEIYIPDRIFEGYGPNAAAIGELAQRASLIVTVDCGTTSFEALEEARKLGVDIVVLDHHQVETDLPPAEAVVNPNRQDDMSGLGYLCAAGVVFMTLAACVRELRRRGLYRTLAEPDLLQMLDLVALATVCDVVPLTGLNRAFVVKGLAVMHGLKNVGLTALARVSRLSGPASPYHLGFLLGPRINAGGRIGDAGLGARLLISEDPGEANEIAEHLNALNRERQLQESRMLEEAIAEAEAEIGNGPGPDVLVAESESWHPGLVGLIASRLKDRFGRPAFAIHFSGNGVGVGSGRSVGAADIGKAVREALGEGILIKGGGHVMAAGITIRHEKLGEFRAFMHERLSEAVALQRRYRALEIDGALTARSATLELCDLLEKAGPFGSGHPSPIFALPAHAVRNGRIFGGDHVSVRVSAGDGPLLEAVAFRAAGTPLGDLLMRPPGALHLSGELQADHWQGRRRIRFRVIDAAVPAANP